MRQHCVARIPDAIQNHRRIRAIAGYRPTGGPSPGWPPGPVVRLARRVADRHGHQVETARRAVWGGWPPGVVGRLARRAAWGGGSSGAVGRLARWFVWGGGSSGVVGRLATESSSQEGHVSMQPINLPLAHLVSPSSQAERPPMAILLHGYGSNEQDLFDLADYFDQRLLVLSLRAPLPLGYGSFAWFEIAITNEGIAVDIEEAEKSRKIIISLIEQAVTGYQADPARVILIGFSQGATMAALVALTRPDLVAATAIISGIVPEALLERMPEPETLHGRAILVQHGTEDTVVPVGHGRATRSMLEGLPVALEYHEYRMPHTIAPEALRDLVQWLQAQV